MTLPYDELNLTITEDVAIIIETPAEQGELGPEGPVGPKGSTWYDGAGLPDESLGSYEDYYLDTLIGDVYTKDEVNGWELVMNIITDHLRLHSITSTSDHIAGQHKIFYSNGSGVVTELAIGADGEVLTSNGPALAPSWEVGGGGGTANSPLTTKGDIWIYSTEDARFPVGTNGYVLSADSSEPTGLKWVEMTGGGISATTEVYNNTGVQIDKGKLVSIIGSFGAVSSVILSDVTTCDCVDGFTIEDIPASTSGLAQLSGAIQEGYINTSGHSPGSTVYLSTNGNWTTTKPTEGSILKVGKIKVEAPTNGAILINLPTFNIVEGRLQDGDTKINIVDTGTGTITVDVDDVENLKMSAARFFEVPIWVYPNGVWMNDKMIFFTDSNNINRSTAVGHSVAGAGNNYIGYSNWQSLCFGYFAGNLLAAGENNCLMGVMAGAFLTTGSRNCYLGSRSGFYQNTNDSTGIGFRTGYFMNSDFNVIIGSYAGYGVQNQTTGDGNVLIGAEAGRVLTTCGGNVFIGYKAGSTYSAVANTLLIENSEDVTYPLLYGKFGSDTENRVCIGCAVPTTANQGLTVRGDVVPDTDNLWSLGRSTHRWDDVYATNGAIQTSDARLKSNIADCDLGLDFICSLKPVSYTWGDRVIYNDEETVEEVDVEEEYFIPADGKIKIEDIIDRDEKFEKIGDRYRIFKTIKKPVTTNTNKPKSFRTIKKHKRTHYGLLSQDIADNRFTDNDKFGGFIHDKENDVFGLRYSEFIAPMIKAIKELKAANDLLTARVLVLEDRINNRDGILKGSIN